MTLKSFQRIANYERLKNNEFHNNQTVNMCTCLCNMLQYPSFDL